MKLPIPPPPKKGAIIYGACATSARPLGVRFENRGGNWVLHWSFRADSTAIQSATQQAINMTNLTVAEVFRGCPYCSNHEFVFCDCGSSVCWDGESTTLFCTICHTEGQLGSIDNLDAGSGM